MRSELGLALEHAYRGARVAPAQLARHCESDDSAADDREIAALGGGGRHHLAPGPPGAVAAAASTRPAPYRRWSPGPPSLRAVARRRAIIWAGVGRRPSTRLAMISAAVADTWGAAIDVPS